MDYKIEKHHSENIQLRKAKRKKRMEEEVKTTLKTIFAVGSSMTYAHFASSSVRPGKIRLVVLLPVVVLLQFLPWQFSSVNLRATSAFFLGCYAPFKLLLLSFGSGPLSPSLPFATFVAVSFLPVRLRSPKSPSPNTFLLLLPFLFKLLVISCIAFLYQSKVYNPYLLVSLRASHIFLALDFGVMFPATAVALLLGLEVEPLHEEPHKSDSLRDLWGRRWNLVVTGIMRPAIYLPLRSRSGPVVAFLTTFLVSGLMHECMFYCVTLARPTGEVTCFFVLHGLCTLGEVMAKRSGWRKPRLAGPLSLGFVAVTAVWLFFPAMIRGGAGEKSIEESVAVLRYLESWRKKGHLLLPGDSASFADGFM